MKRRLTSAPILVLPTDDANFIVYCEASKIGLGTVLTQKGKVNCVYFATIEDS